MSEVEGVCREVGSEALCSFCSSRPVQYWRRPTIFGLANFCGECLAAYRVELGVAVGVVNGEGDFWGEGEAA